ncbi:MAG: hypothetical protein LBR28_01445 [Bacteroidales bacterium]|jgi:hypothetical protein|nr:hypothetical protein [Bacteroidales bacterium]
MKKGISILVLILVLISGSNLKSQTIEETCGIIQSEIVDNQYHSFTLSGSGYLSYVWTDQKDSETTINIDLTQVTISKDISNTGYKVWIKCIDQTNCIVEQGRVGSNEYYYSEYSKTYLPAKSVEGMEAIYLQLEYLLKLSNGIR